MSAHGDDLLGQVCPKRRAPPTHFVRGTAWRRARCPRPCYGESSRRCTPVSFSARCPLSLLRSGRGTTFAHGQNVPSPYAGRPQMMRAHAARSSVAHRRDLPLPRLRSPHQVSTGTARTFHALLELQVLRPPHRRCSAVAHFRPCPAQRSVVGGTACDLPFIVNGSTGSTRRRRTRGT